MVTPATGGAPKGSQTVNEPTATAVAPDGIVVTPVTTAPPPLTLYVVLTHCEELVTPVM